MTPTIFVDDEVLEALGKRARPFIDTQPNQVLRRLLGLEEMSDGQSSVELETPNHAVVPFDAEPRRTRTKRGRKAASTTGKRKRAPKGSLLDETAYWDPILRALEENGGRLAASEVIERVGELVDDQLKPMDRETLETGGVRWHSRVQFARLRMKDEGLLNPSSPRGVWEISDLGRQRLETTTTTAAA